MAGIFGGGGGALVRALQLPKETQEQYNAIAKKGKVLERV